MARPEQNAVKDIVGELIETDIVRESNSPYSSPVLLVKKKNGEQRMCIDYRKLNSLTVKDRYPLPRIEDQLDRVHGQVYFTSLDLKSWYHQIPIEEFNRLPFGLTNAFQRLINKVLIPARDKASIYLDILLPSKTVEEELHNLEEILTLLRHEGLTLNCEKCSFLMKEVSYLEFDISAGKVRPGNLKTKAISEFPVPKSVHNVRQFVENYAQIARKLTDLTRKDCPWRWTEQENKAILTLKSK